MFFYCKSLFLSLKLHALVLKVKNINVVLVCNHENENWKAIYMSSSSTVHQCPYARSQAKNFKSHHNASKGCSYTESTIAFFASFSGVLLAETTFALRVQVTLVMIYSISSNIYANTAVCRKYFATTRSASLRSRLMVFFQQICLVNLSPKRQQVECRISFSARYRSQQFCITMSGTQANNAHHPFLLLMETR